MICILAVVFITGAEEFRRRQFRGGVTLEGIVTYSRSARIEQSQSSLAGSVKSKGDEKSNKR